MKKIFYIGFFACISCIFPFNLSKNVRATGQTLSIMTYNILWLGQTDDRLNRIAKRIKDDMLISLVSKSVEGGKKIAVVIVLMLVRQFNI